mmetsp:Transcript_116387/g.311879  ORF Transcript_116387/g.311879 Transcript_116387/m.311879 type:complete len:528 (-) Transcript_116387:170-1753(-)
MRRAMALIAGAFALVAACDALSPGRGRGDLEGLGGELGGGDGADFGVTRGGIPTWAGEDVAEAEAAAVRAREEAARIVAQEGADARMSARQMDAIKRRAESQFQQEEREEGLLTNVVDKMDREVDQADSEVKDLERKLGQLEGAVRRGRLDSRKDAGGAGGVAEWTVAPEDEQEPGGTWYDEKVDPAVRRQQRALAREEKAFGQEQSQEAKLMVHARGLVDRSKAQERMYLQRRGALEHDLKVRFVQEAGALRQAAANGTLSEGEALRLLDITSGDLANMTRTLSGFGPKDVPALWIEERLEASRRKSAASSAKMVEAIRHKLETFKSTHLDYDDKQFLARLAQLFSEAKAEIKEFEETRDMIMKRLQGWDKSNGEKLTYTLALAIDGATSSGEFRSHLLRADTDSLRHADMGQACELLGNVIHSSMQPAYKSLQQQKATLDGMSKIVPTITATMPSYIQETMANRTAALLEMAYGENLALKETAANILKEASPVVLSRLHCAMRSASLRPSFAAAVAAAALAWLAQ